MTSSQPAGWTAAELAQAAARGQLDLHYQPLVDLRDHRIAGAEALMRWRHPRLGLLPPGQFLPLAESFGLTGRPGIVVAGIFRDGPAQKAGLQLGDVILSIDGAPAGDGRKSMNQVARIKPTDKVAILVMRNGKEIKLSAEIGLRPPPATAPPKEEQ